MRRAFLIVFLISVISCVGCKSSLFGGSRGGDSKTSEIVKEHGEIVGIISCFDRVVVLPTFVLRVELIENDDSSSKVISYTEIELKKDFPIEYSLPYVLSGIREDGKYNVRAYVLCRGKTMLETDSDISVLTQGANKNADLVLVKVKSF